MTLCVDNKTAKTHIDLLSGFILAIFFQRKNIRIPKHNGCKQISFLHFHNTQVFMQKYHEDLAYQSDQADSNMHIRSV